MYRILLAVSGAEEEEESDVITDALMSLPVVTEEVTVTIMNVFEEFEVTGEGATVSSDELYENSDFPAEVNRACARLEEKGLSVEVRREHGDPTEKILEVADELETDLIAMGGRKQTPIGKVIFGSTTQAVMLGAERPVLVIMD